MEQQKDYKKMVKSKKLIIVLQTILLTLLSNTRVFAETIGIKEVEQATVSIKNAIVELAMPIGAVIVFVSIVTIALKMIFTANNPNRRSENIGALVWVCAGAILLGLALVVSGIIVGIATNNTGNMI